MTSQDPPFGIDGWTPLHHAFGKVVNACLGNDIAINRNKQVPDGCAPFTYITRNVLSAALREKRTLELKVEHGSAIFGPRAVASLLAHEIARVFCNAMMSETLVSAAVGRSGGSMVPIDAGAWHVPSWSSRILCRTIDRARPLHLNDNSGDWVLVRDAETEAFCAMLTEWASALPSWDEVFTAHEGGDDPTGPVSYVTCWNWFPCRVVGWRDDYSILPPIYPRTGAAVLTLASDTAPRDEPKAQPGGLEQRRWADIIDRASRAYNKKAENRRAERPRGGPVIRNMIRDLADDLDAMIDGPVAALGGDVESLAVASDAIMIFVDGAQKHVVAYASALKGAGLSEARAKISEQRERVRTAIELAANPVAPVVTLPVVLSDHLPESNPPEIADKERTLADVVADSGDLPKRGKRGRPSAKAHYMPLFEARLAAGKCAETAHMEAANLAHIMATDPMYNNVPRAVAETIYNAIVPIFPPKQ